MISKKKEIIIFLSILVLFIGLRLPGLHASYHQDEYKWVYDTYEYGSSAGKIPHPPLAEFLYLKAGPMVGINDFRFIPFVLGIIDLFLIFYLVRMLFDVRTALWTAFLYAVAFYSILASLMVDVDGQFMPLFFLIMMISYCKLKAKHFELKGNWLYLVTLVIGVVGGTLIKLSGVLPVGALALDFAIEKRAFQDVRRVVKYALLGLATLITLGIAIYLSKYIFTYFDISKFSIYWKHFANSSSFFGRGWLQTFIQFAKSILYTSPLLIAPVFFVDKEIWKKTRSLFLFIFVGTAFYLFVFDFSLGALDRYFQFFVVPFCIISGAVFAKFFDNKEEKLDKEDFIIIPIVTIGIFVLQFFYHFVPPLYPKIEWINKVISLKWNFLFPFTGGSGPLPFYVSFLFIALIWICSAIFILSGLKIKDIKKRALFCVLVLGILYNGVFIEEYLFGKINGSAEILVKDSVARIVADESIKEVMVYNDNGAFQVQRTGKYFRRIYATPTFEPNYKLVFDKYKGHILYINIPRISDDSMYKKYFDSCQVVFSESNKQISSKIYDCSKLVTKKNF